MPDEVMVTSPATIRVPAGTTAGTALREHEQPNKGPEAIVVVREPRATSVVRPRGSSSSR